MLLASQGSGCNLLPTTQTSPDPFRNLVEPWSEGLGIIYVLVCLFVCVSVCACVSLTSYACFYVLLCMFLCVCLCVSMFLCVCLCHCEWCLYLCDCVSENAFVCFCLCPCTVAGASLGLTLRGRGLPVHVYNPATRLDQWHPVELSLVVAVVHPTKHHHTVESSNHAPHLKGQWVQPSPSYTDLSGAF